MFLRRYARTCKKLGNMSGMGCENAVLPSDGLAFCTTLFFLIFKSAKRVIGDVPQKTIKSKLNTAALRR